MLIDFTKEELMQMQQIDDLMSHDEDEGIVVGYRTRRRY